jgi:hypothetical protein
LKRIDESPAGVRLSATREASAARFRAMKDVRVAVFRKTLEGLIESLDATVRVNRWAGAETIPEPLKESAAHLVARLGTVDRLANGNFKGSPADTARVNVMIGVMRRLDAAYVVYRQQLERSPQKRDNAAMTLDAEIDEVKADSSWKV